jgi:hypothetical protein
LSIAAASAVLFAPADQIPRGRHVSISPGSLDQHAPAETALRLSGIEPKPLQRVADSGRINTRLVCPECGSWICGLPRDGVVRVRAGSLDDTSWLQPTRHIWTRSKQPWITFAEGDEIFEAQPPA